MGVGPLARLAICALLAVGCATANVRPHAPYDPQRAYLYGRFTIEGQSMKFSIRCRGNDLRH